MFAENEGGGQRPFGTFPKIHPFWSGEASLRMNKIWKNFGDIDIFLNLTKAVKTGQNVYFYSTTSKFELFSSVLLGDLGPSASSHLVNIRPNKFGASGYSACQAQIRLEAFSQN